LGSHSSRSSRRKRSRKGVWSSVGQPENGLGDGCGDVDKRPGQLSGWYLRDKPELEYRPFTAVEAAGQLDRSVKIGEFDRARFSVAFDGIYVQEKWFRFDYALKHGTLFDTGEPFGIKVVP
jgi:hypothetical protein